MILKSSNFSDNCDGHLKGLIVVYSDQNEPLGISHQGDYARDADKALRAKVVTAGLDPEVFEVKLRRVLAGLQSAHDAGADEEDDDGSDDGLGDLPSIVVTNRPMRDISEDCWGLLRGPESEPPRYFRLGNVLSEVSGVEARDLTLTRLKGQLDRLADFTQYRTDGTAKSARPPTDVVEDMLALLDPSLPELKGVVSGPVCRADGSIVSRSGYDRDTGLYLALEDGLSMPAVPESPTRDDIEGAKDLFDELLFDFPLVADADRAHVIAANLNPLVRPMVEGPTPLFLIESPEAGTGKGLLANVIARIATGRDAPTTPESHGEAEWSKKLTSLFLGAPSFILFDNVIRRLESSKLSLALTTRVWVERYLGTNRIVSLPITATWMVTANNPALSTEIARRAVDIRMDAALERPAERRVFLHPRLLEWVRQNRGRLLWAALTLVRAWVSAGRPRGQVAMGSFESWVETIGGILDNAEIPGFLANREKLYSDADADLEEAREFVDAWAVAHVDEEVGVQQLFELAKERKLLLGVWADKGDRGARTAIGIWLRRMRDRRIGQYQIRKAGSGPDGRIAHYKLELSEREGPAKVR